MWTASAIEPEGRPWYRTADASAAGSVAIAREAVKRQAYTLLERPTYLTVRLPRAVVLKADPRLLNVFTIIPVSPTRCADVNVTGAAAFVEWLLGEQAQTMIGAFRRPEHRVAGFLRADQILLPRSG